MAATLVNLGTPVITSRQWTTALVPNSGGTGWNYVASVWNGDLNPVEWIVVKNLTGTPIAPSGTTYFTPTHGYANILFQYYDQLRAPNGRVFFPCVDNYTAVYDPITEAVTALGPLIESPPVDPNASTVLYSAVFDTAGQLYMGTQESQNRRTTIVQTNPTSLSQSILGYVGTGALGYTTYGYYIAPDTTGSNKYVYVAYGQDPWQLWALNITSGSHFGSGTMLYASTANGHIAFQDIHLSGWTAQIHSDLGQPDDIFTQWWCLDGAIYPYTASLPPPVSARNVAPVSNPIVSPPDIDIMEGAGRVGWRPNGTTGSYTVVTYPVQDVGPALIESLVNTPNGVLGNAAQYQGFFRASSTGTNWFGVEENVNISGGPRLNVNGTVYMSGYPDGVLYSYNPNLSWQETTAPPINPQLLGYYGPSGILFSGMKYATYLAYSAGAGPAGRLYCSGFRERSGAGAGIGYYDFNARSFSGTFAAPLDGVYPTGLVVMDSLGFVVMATKQMSGSVYTPILVYDQGLNFVSSRTPLAVSDLGSIYPTSDNSIVCGLVQRSGSLALYRYDVHNNLLLSLNMTQFTGTIDSVATKQNDGTLWAAVGNNLVQVDPNQATAAFKFDISSIAPVGVMAFDGAELFLTSGSTLFSLDFGTNVSGPLFMKKVKTYRPRRGLRFSDDPSSSRPVASFIGSVAVTRTRQTKVKKNSQIHTVDTIMMSGFVSPSIGGPPGTIYGVNVVPTTGSGPPPVTLQSITISPSPALIT